MREWLIFVSENSIIIIDAMALVIVAFATIEAFIGAVRTAPHRHDNRERREIWLRFSRWLVAALTFQLAADVIETSITSSWDALGRIAVVAIIRTFLNYFLDRDLAEARERQHETTPEPEVTK